jgi:hypothetical protein
MSDSPVARIEAEVVVPAAADEELVAIEYPGYVRSVGRALETFGGARALGAMLSVAAPSAAAAAAGASAPAAPPPRLQLRLRPADPLSHPLTSDAPVVGRRALLLRIARPAASRRRRGGGDGEGDGDPAPPPPTITAAGLVMRTYRFTSLADAQYLPLDGRAGAPSGCGGVAGAGADLSAGGRDVSSLPPDAQPPAAEAFGAPAPFLMAPPRFLASGEPVEYDFTASNDDDAAGGGEANGAGSTAAAAAAATTRETAAAAAVAAAEAAAEVALAAVLRQRLATIEFSATAVPLAVPLDRAAEYLARRTDRALRTAANAAAAAASAAGAEAGATEADAAATTPASSSIRPELDAFIARLDALFAERRAWLEPVLRERSGLDELASAAQGAASSPSSVQSLRAQRLARDAAALLRAAVYRFRTGPWRHQLVRRGYDPRRDPHGAAGLQGVKAARPLQPPAGGERDAAPALATSSPSAVRVLCQLRALPQEAGRLHWRVQARDVVAAAERAAAGGGGASPAAAAPSLAPVRNRRVPTETTGWLSQTTLRELSVAATALYARAAAAAEGGAEEEQEDEEEQSLPPPPSQQQQDEGAAVPPQAADVDQEAAAAEGAQAGPERPPARRASRERSLEEEQDEEGAMEEDDDDEDEDGRGGGALDDAAALSTDEGGGR